MGNTNVCGNADKNSVAQPQPGNKTVSKTVSKEQMDIMSKQKSAEPKVPGKKEWEESPWMWQCPACNSWVARRWTGIWESSTCVVCDKVTAGLDPWNTIFKDKQLHEKLKKDVPANLEQEIKDLNQLQKIRDQMFKNEDAKLIVSEVSPASVPFEGGNPVKLGMMKNGTHGKQGNTSQMMVSYKASSNSSEYRDNLKRRMSSAGKGPDQFNQVLQARVRRATLIAGRKNKQIKAAQALAFVYGQQPLTNEEEQIQFLMQEERKETDSVDSGTKKLIADMQAEDEAAAQNTGAKAAEADEEFCCTICFCAFEELDSEILPLTMCDNIFHTECLQEYIDDQIQQLKLNILCPDAQCGKQLCDKDIQTCVSDESFQKWQKFTFNQLIDTEDALQWCPKPGCTFAFCNDGQKDFTCPLCKGQYCIECRYNSHKGYTCEEYEQQKDQIERDRKDGTDALINFAKENNLKRCPKCKSFTEKTAGCNYISCKCGGKWCWPCNAIYNGTKCSKCGAHHGLNEVNGPLAKGFKA